MGGCRASRIHRPATPPRLCLTDRDLDLMEDLARVRFLTAGQVEWLHFPPREGRRARGFSSACRTRLRWLWQAGYLDRLWPDRFHGPAVYTLTRRGLEALAAYRGYVPEAGSSAGRGVPGAAFLEHALGVARAYAAIRAALREVEGVWVADFRGERSFKGVGDHDTLLDIADGRRAIPIIPDGLFVLERADGRRRLVFLEVDRGTIPLKRIAARVRGYEGYRIGVGPSLFRARFGLSPVFIVAFVAPTLGRMRSLRKAVRKELGRWGWENQVGSYLFHTLPNLVPETALVWEDAEGKEVSLLGG